MNELLWKIPDGHSTPAPSSHWQRTWSADTKSERRTPRAGHSFADTRVRQSVAPALQAKLTVSHPGDSAEVEADRVADAVMAMPASQSASAAIDRQEDSALQRACAACNEEQEIARAPEDEEEIARAPEDEEEIARAPEDEEEIARAPEDEEEIARAPEDEEDVQRMEDDEDSALQAKTKDGGVPEVTPAISSQIQAVHSAGEPLSRDTRNFFEPRMGVDLGNVRVQTGSQASNVARQLNARAFTVGNNITFGAGHYQPSSSQGKRLLAHELTHVIQQGGASSRSDDQAE